jgi:trk/ktr system potassium uptake protein
MQHFAVIGLGRFGSRLASNLAAAGEEVVAIDRNRRLVEQIRDRVTLSVALDCTDEEALLSQRIDQVDVAVVSVGDDFEVTALTTAILKHIGVKKIISRAVSETQARILSRIGADAVVNPEDESADRWATRLISPHFLKQYELEPGYSIVEVKLPVEWAGRTLMDLALRRKLGVHVLAIKRTAQDEGQAEPTTHLQIPQPDYPFKADDVLVVMGSDEGLAAMPGSE